MLNPFLVILLEVLCQNVKSYKSTIYIGKYNNLDLNN